LEQEKARKRSFVEFKSLDVCGCNKIINLLDVKINREDTEDLEFKETRDGDSEQKDDLQTKTATSLIGKGKEDSEIHSESFLTIDEECKPSEQKLEHIISPNYFLVPRKKKLLEFAIDGLNPTSVESFLDVDNSYEVVILLIISNNKGKYTILTP
jgi:hypothetical protein